jgi:hypothetical protein
MGKRASLFLTLILSFLFLTVLWVQFPISVQGWSSPHELEGFITPTASIVKPQNATYFDAVPLIFTTTRGGFAADSPYSSYQLFGIGYSYSIDGQPNVPITGNTTLTDLPLGNHSLIISSSYSVSCGQLVGPFSETSEAVSFTVANNSVGAVREKAQAFIEDVLPIECINWLIELKVDGNATEAREQLEANNLSASGSDRVLVYFLGSMVGTADSIELIFVVRDNILVKGVMNIDNSPTYRQTYRQSVTPLSADNVTDFLVNYQDWSGLDSAEMAVMLSNVDIRQNTSRTSGNLTMTIQYTDDSYDTTELLWMYPFCSNDVRFGVTFQKDFPVSFIDERQFPLSAATPTSTPTSNVPESVPNSTFTLAIAAATLAAVLISLSIYLRTRSSKYIR